ncbi:MAG TPA: DNA recombination protein RmuC [Candidatus Faecousia intestinigallinarum]|nr:DNA recombination protein RmuC [Candidatus Faecousia intestinigallinarum]
MEFIILALLALNLIGLGLLLLRLAPKKKEAEHRALQDALLKQSQEAAGTAQQGVIQAIGAFGQGVNGNITSLSESLTGSISAMRAALTENQASSAALQAERLESIDRHVISRQEAMNQTVDKQMQAMALQLSKMESGSEEKLEALRKTMQDAMDAMRRENTQKLEQIQGIVDEKLQDTLQKRITESFQTVSTQLEQVYKGLGEMQHLASDVGGLKQVLSGVKTRGILGEIQLKAILEEILSPEQYEENVATIPGSHERVEFAIRLPGSDGKPVYLPIDSKFPGDTFMHLQDAQLSGDAAALEEARKNLTAVLKRSAKDICTKYVEPPYTTTFGILFLPFEGLYAEVVNMGLIEVLQREYSVNVAGPSTMAALLNALQMGFHTLAIQKRSSEVWQILGAVKTEFGKFEDVMVKMQGHLRQTSDDLEALMGTRTRAINRKLREVHQLDESTAQQLLEGE